MSSEEKEEEEKKAMYNNCCGDIIYASPSLKKRILKYRTEEDEDDNDNILRSLNSETAIKLLFINESESDLYVYWLNHEGEIRFPADLISAHAKHKINSFVSHPFIVSFTSDLNEFKDILAVYVAIATKVSYSQHNITINKTATKLSCKGIKSSNKIWTINSYERYVINGFTVYFENGLIEKYSALIHVLNNDLKKINEIVPNSALKILQSTAIWLNDNYLYYNYGKLKVYKPRESMCFHPDRKWLINNGNLSEKTECIEIYRIVDWFKERGFMPMVLLHEFSHSFHYYLDFQRKDVLNAYNCAKKNNLYQNVAFILGGKCTAYALTDHKEYFAELSESYFGLNDYYPFNKEELQKYDKIGYELMQNIWHLNDEQIFSNHTIALRNRHLRKQQKENKRYELDIARIVSL